jgi:hypothetical protein
MPDDPLCGYCRMPLSKHCRGNVEHIDEYKNRIYRVTCRTRHCLAPLCDCVDYVEPQEKKEVQNAPAQAQQRTA